MDHGVRYCQWESTLADHGAVTATPSWLTREILFQAIYVVPQRDLICIAPAHHQKELKQSATIILLRSDNDGRVLRGSALKSHAVRAHGETLGGCDRVSWTNPEILVEVKHRQPDMVSHATT